jgi:hypothetical protein
MNLLFESGETYSWGEKVLKILAQPIEMLKPTDPIISFFAMRPQNQLNLTFGN